MGEFMKATRMSQNKTSRSFTRDMTNRTLCVYRGFELPVPQTALALAWAPSSCNTMVWTKHCQSRQLAELPDTKEIFSHNYFIGGRVFSVFLNMGTLSRC